MPERKYAPSHEWVILDGDVATIGISEFAVEQLGDVVYVDLPPVGKQLKAGETIGDIESVKAVSQIYTPVSGEVVEVNGDLEGSPETINSSPLENGWIIRLRASTPAEVEGMMDEEAYTKHASGSA